MPRLIFPRAAVNMRDKTSAFTKESYNGSLPFYRPSIQINVLWGYQKFDSSSDGRRPPLNGCKERMRDNLPATIDPIDPN